MPESDPSRTQLDIGGDEIADGDLVAELSALGFDDAVEIGRGGFGIVYRCSEAALDRTVAVKVLTVDLDENRERFVREQKAMGRLTGHPNIVGVLQVGETEDGHPFLVMPYHPQGSLEERIRRLGPRPFDEVLRVGVKIASALEATHHLDILHRDVKPANILLTDYGEPALCDFGIAHISGGFKTSAGLITGSPAFTAPEILSGEPPTEATDVYGLGSTLFCALTGHAAFERRSGEQVVTQFLRITSESAPDLRDSGIPEELSAVIELAMSHNPSERPTAIELGEQLRRVQSDLGLPVDAMPLQPGSEQQVDTATPRAGLRRTSGRRDTGFLPLELTSFVGRRRQLARLENLLSASRLVTLTGIGGVGKTRLALQAVSRVQQNFSDGVRLAELGDLHDAAVLVDVIAAAVGVRNLSGPSTRKVLIDFLATRQLLLVLDNCEHLVEAVAELAEALLRTCPELSILATSREALGVGGESMLAVGPLDFPDPATEPTLRALAGYDAVKLFTERAAAAVPGFKLTEENRLCVVQICARLDGLPLAIELAAARLRAMSADQILSRLDDRYALLTHGDRGGPTRQQTLQWCIGWSYDLCTPVEQRLWARLSVFAGSFELEAAEDVCGDDLAAADLEDALSALVDKSILVREQSGGAIRFQMLETVQDYGREILDNSGDTLQLCRRHRNWYARLVSEAEIEWIGPHQLDWISRLKQELPNLRRALDFGLAEENGGGLRMAAVLYPFWLLGGRLGEGRTWIERTLAHSAGAPDLYRAKALYSACSLASLTASQGDLPAATEPAAALRRLAEQATDPAIAALAAAANGLTAFMRGDPACAITGLAGAVEALHTSGELLWQIDALQWYGFSCDLHGDYSRALACQEQVLALTQSHGEMVFRSWSLWHMGVVFFRQGEFDHATQSLTDGLRLTRLTGDPLVTANILEALAWIAAEQHDAHRAAVLLGSAEALGREAGSPTVLFPYLLGYHEVCTRYIHGELDAKAFDVALREGSSTSLDAAVAFALGERRRTTTRRRLVRRRA